ncbi:MAG: hypothetical protein GF311_04730 [Candidatus Lokiarchaeota archaeon]|nr:hypothetical protein [Candidatus Lokiarchaeota archaeon]
MTEDFDRLMKRWCIPRLAGSEGSQEIVARLKGDFDLFGFDFEEQRFPVFKSDTSFNLSLKFLILGILLVIFLLLYWYAFWYSFLILPLIILLPATIKRKLKCYNLMVKN